jgi:hypothetical protein
MHTHTHTHIHSQINTHTLTHTHTHTHTCTVYHRDVISPASEEAGLRLRSPNIIY